MKFIPISFEEASRISHIEAYISHSYITFLKYLYWKSSYSDSYHKIGKNSLMHEYLKNGEKQNCPEFGVSPIVLSKLGKLFYL